MNRFVEVHMLSIFIAHAKDEDETNDESVYLDFKMIACDSSFAVL